MSLKQIIVKTVPEIYDCIRDSVQFQEDRRVFLGQSGKASIGVIVASMLPPLAVSLITGCATPSQPNPSLYNVVRQFSEEDENKIIAVYRKEPERFYKEKAHVLFSQLGKQSPLLAHELGKLPEYQNGVTPEKVKDLGNLVTLYFENKTKFDDAFNDMHKIGLPEVRKFNSPLQALYWLIADGGEDEAKKILDEGYTLEKLLDIAWYTEESISDAKWKWLNSEVNKLDNSVQDNEIKNKIDQFKGNRDQYHSDKNFNYHFVWHVIDLAKEFPNSFSHKFDEQIFEKYREKNKNRWKNFDAVVERLNAPELVSYYIANNFTYQITKLRSIQTPKKTYSEKGGVCRQWSSYGVGALDMNGFNRNGYKVKNVTSVWGYWQGHTVGALKDPENNYFIIVDSDNPGRISGPFKSFREIAYAIAPTKNIEIYIENNATLIQRNARAN